MHGFLRLGRRHEKHLPQRRVLTPWFPGVRNGAHSYSDMSSGAGSSATAAFATVPCGVHSLSLPRLFLMSST